MDINDIKKENYSREELESFALNYFELCEELHNNSAYKDIETPKAWDLVYSHYDPNN